jgi:hypothetical protein
VATGFTQAQPDPPALELVKSFGINPFLSTVLLLMAGRADVSCQWIWPGAWTWHARDVRQGAHPKHVKSAFCREAGLGTPPTSNPSLTATTACSVGQTRSGHCCKAQVIQPWSLAFSKLIWGALCQGAAFLLCSMSLLGH